jgi:hypothetical protein
MSVGRESAKHGVSDRLNPQHETQASHVNKIFAFPVRHMIKGSTNTAESRSTGGDRFTLFNLGQ